MTSNDDFEFEQRTDTLRKVEFDKGIPLSMDFPDNSVSSVNLNFLQLIRKNTLKIFSRPNYLLLSALYIFFVVAISLHYDQVFKFEVLWPILPPAAFILLEFIFEFCNSMLTNGIDSETNAQNAQVYDVYRKDFLTVKWKDLKVGHVIKVLRDEIVPADIIILEAIDRNHICYADESSITGVFDCFTTKKACIDTRSPVMKQVNISEYIKNIKGMIKYEQPNIDMKRFDARLKLESYPRASGISIENFMLRGSSLKNTKAIYGLVVYTGMDTKIMQVLKSKKYDSEGKKERNFLFTSLKKIQYLFVVFYILILIVYIINMIYKYRKVTNGLIKTESYIHSSSNMDFYFSIFEFAVIFQMIIPYTWFNLIYISFYIMSYFIEYDIRVRINSKNSTEIINKDCLPDFGKVKYILADKTGTLTSRKFNIKGLTYNGNFYNFDLSNIETGLFKYSTDDISETQLYKDLKKSSIETDELTGFIEELAINHSVSTWKSEVGSSSNENFNNERKLGSAFAEEKALMKFLEGFGFYLKKATEKKVEIEVNKNKKVFDIIGRNKYTNNRKCSSVIYKRLQNDDESVLLCKSYDYNNISKLIKEETQTCSRIKFQIEKMNEMGYRYIILLKKNLSAQETEDFIENYKAAQNNLLQKDNLYENIAFGVECEMSLVGALFFEESFSDDLRFALNKLNLADIHTWIVSGDRSTNVEALSRNLNMFHSQPSEIIYLLENDHRDDIDSKINNQLILILNKKNSSDFDEDDLKASTSKELRKTTIFIHGKAFSTICSDTRLYQIFSILLLHTDSFFGSGFTPTNKHALTRIMKKFICHNCKLLAIGDGLNDVMMLKEADLSIGIRSKEILQVKNTCDLIVSKFSQIPDLILVHGSWNLKRIIQICFYSLYASLVILMPLFHNIYFSEVFTSSEPDYLFLLTSLLIFNFCIVTIFCFNQHVERCLLIISPHIFSNNFENSNLKIQFLETIMKAIIDSYIIYYAFYMVGYDSVLNSEGFVVWECNQWVIYLITSYLVILLKLALIQLSIINFFNFLILFVSLVGILVIGYIRINTLDNIFDSLSSLTLVITIFGVVAFCVLYDFAIKNYFYFFENNILFQLVRKANNIVKDYSFLIDYDKHVNYLTTPVFPKVLKEYNKFEDIVKILSNDKIPVDSTIDNLSNLNNDKIVSTKIKMSLKFKNLKMESDYSLYFLDQNRFCFVFYLFIKLLYWLIYFCLLVIFEKIELSIITCSIQVGFTLIGFLLTCNCFKLNFYNWFILYFYLNIILDILLVFFKSKYNEMEICLQFIINLTYPLLFGSRHLIQILIGTIIYFFGLIISIFITTSENKRISYSSFISGGLLDNPNNTSNIVYDDSNYHFLLYYFPITLNQVFIIFASMLTMLVYGYYEELRTRINFIKFVKKSNDKRKDDEIFDNLVPKFIQNKMKTGDRGTTKNSEVVTIIFANIAEFDDLVAKLKPRELISLLDKIYGTFDQLSIIHGIQKIETVGYTYMGTGGLKECEKDMDENSLIKHHAIRAFELALDMIDVMSGIVLGNGEKVKLKIGLHTGKVLAGVIGEHKPQFSLIGDTVNTAARMGAKVDKMCALLTEETYNIVKEEYPDFEEKLKTFKGKGEMKCFQANPLKKKKERQDAKMKVFKNFLTKFLQRAIQEAEGTDIQFEDFFSKEKQTTTALNRQVSCRSNQSNFIVEEDILKENHDEHMEDAGVINREEYYKSRRTKSVNEKNQLSVSKASEFNLLFRKSFLLITFSDKQSLTTDENKDSKTDFSSITPYRLYSKYKHLRMLSGIEPSIYINYIFGILTTFVTLNSSEYNPSIKYNMLIIFLKYLFLIFLGFLIFQSKKLIKNNKQFFEYCLIINYLGNLIIQQIKINVLPNQFWLESVLEQNLIILVIGFNVIIDYKKIFISLFLSMIILSMNIIGNRHNDLIITYYTLSLIINIAVLIFVILREYIGTFDYIKNQQVTEELIKAKKLLFNLMPPHVVISLKEDRTVADVIDNVTILYTDIVNFTKFSAAQKDQSNIVRMLIELFKRMDNACIEHDVYKVHTIGDCFVVLSFTGKVPMNERNYIEEARNVVKIGRKMIEIIRSVRETKEVNFPTLNMRIGIHTGKIIAGIIGSTIVRYDIFGSDCLVANMMESEGQEGRVNVSEDTRRFLDMDEENKFSYTFNAKIDVPSVGRVYDSYLVDFSN